MSTAAASAQAPPLPARPADPLAGFLSYLIPGLGQVYQGRVFKGVMFFCCIMVMFFYGLYLGSWSNVFLPQTARLNNPWNLPPLGANLYNRPQFAAQFFVGIAAWPAIIQYATYDPNEETNPFLGSYQRAPYETRLEMEPTEDQLEQAGNSRKALRKEMGALPTQALKDWKGKTLNELQTEGDKTWDLGWVFTVIAGVLNLMVIYDAVAGPAFVIVEPKNGPKQGA